MILCRTMMLQMIIESRLLEVTVVARGGQRNMLDTQSLPKHDRDYVSGYWKIVSRQDKRTTSIATYEGRVNWKPS